MHPREGPGWRIAREDYQLQAEAPAIEVSAKLFERHATSVTTDIGYGRRWRNDWERIPPLKNNPAITKSVKVDPAFSPARATWPERKDRTWSWMSLSAKQ